jgi:hypothetical protein
MQCDGELSLYPLALSRKMQLPNNRKYAIFSTACRVKFNVNASLFKNGVGGITRNNAGCDKESALTDRTLPYFVTALALSNPFTTLFKQNFTQLHVVAATHAYIATLLSTAD